MQMFLPKPPDLSTLLDLSFLSVLFSDIPWGHPLWIVALPLAAALVGFLISGRSARLALSVGAVALFAAALLSVAQAVRASSDRSPDGSAFAPSLPVQGFDIPLDLQVTPLTALVSLVVAWVAFIVLVFSRWYLWFDPRYRVFAATLTLFTGAMQLVVLSGDVVLTLVGWELMGWCSFLLVGHRSDKTRARQAASKAFLYTRLADLPLLMGFAALCATAGTTRINDVVAFWVAPPSEQAPLLSLALVGIVIGVLGKSGQVPFQDWLADAMEGPAPASALIHAATMVAAGTVLLTSIQPLLEANAIARGVLVIAASVTMVLAAATAFLQEDIKRLFAWSTMSQVAVMLAVLASMPVGAAADSAITYLAGHAVVKALVFLVLGWAGVLVGATTALSLSGLVWRFRTLRRPWALALLGLAGAPPLVGFFAKDLVVHDVLRAYQDGGGWQAGVALFALILTVPLTAAYCMRVWYLTVYRTYAQRVAARAIREAQGPRRVDIEEIFEADDVTMEAEGAEEAESIISWSARRSISVLCVATVLGGIVVITPLVAEEFVLDWRLTAALLITLFLAAFAIVLMGRNTLYGDAAVRMPVGVRTAADRGWHVSDAASLVIVRPVLAVARAVRWADREVVDAYPALAVRAVEKSGEQVDRVHTRRPATGLLAVVIGLVVVAVLGVTLW